MGEVLNDGGIRVGITFEDAQMTIDGTSLADKFNSFAEKNHTHAVASINGLAQYVQNTIGSKKYLELDDWGFGQMMGSLTCEDVFYNDGSGLDEENKVSLNSTIDGIRDKLTSFESHTVQHLTLTNDINVKVGSPVFFTGEVINIKTGKVSDVKDSTDCVPIIKSIGTYKDFIGICTEVDASVSFSSGLKSRNTTSTTTKLNGEVYAYTRFASHGDFLFSVKDSDMYKIGDTVDFSGNIIDEYAPLTNKVRRSIVGVITKIINKETVSIFKV